MTGNIFFYLWQNQPKQQPVVFVCGNCDLCAENRIYARKTKFVCGNHLFMLNSQFFEVWNGQFSMLVTSGFINVKYFHAFQSYHTV